MAVLKQAEAGTWAPDLCREYGINAATFCERRSQYGGMDVWLITRMKEPKEENRRIKELYGVVPGSMDFKAEQSFLQPGDDAADIVPVIKGVIEAEAGAIAYYTEVIKATDGVDPVTQDMIITILADEQGHLRLFEGYLKEYEAEGRA